MTKKSLQRVLTVMLASVMVVSVAGISSFSADEETPSTGIVTVADSSVTVEQLANMSLKEIVDIMGGEFEITNSYEHAFLSYGNMYIYNYDKLPNMAFEVIVNSAEQDLDVIKSNIINGVEIGDLGSIVLFGDAKLNDKISANMTYNQIKEVFGECSFSASDTGVIGYPISKIHNRITFSLDYPQDLPTDDETLSNANPNINGIRVNHNYIDGSKYNYYDESLEQWQIDYINWINCNEDVYDKDYNKNKDLTTKPKYYLMNVDETSSPEIFMHLDIARIFSYFVYYNEDGFYKQPCATVNELYYKKNNIYFVQASSNPNLYSYSFVNLCSYSFVNGSLELKYELEATNYDYGMGTGEYSDELNYYVVKKGEYERITKEEYDSFFNEIKDANKVSDLTAYDYDGIIEAIKNWNADDPVPPKPTEPTEPTNPTDPQKPTDSTNPTIPTTQPTNSPTPTTQTTNSPTSSPVTNTVSGKVVNTSDTKTVVGVLATLLASAGAVLFTFKKRKQK